MSSRRLIAAGLCLCLLSCTNSQSEPAAAADNNGASESAGLTLPAGFTATIVADELGRGRHIIVRENGDIYVSLRQKHPDHDAGIVALRDTNDDGRADEIKYFGDVAGTGIDLYGSYLYFGERTRVVRFKFASPTELVPSGPLKVVIDGFPEQRAHAAKPITFDDRGHLYVNIGVPSNACQEQVRTPGSPGRRPCPELDGRGIYRYDATELNQQHPGDGLHFATGLRQTVALEWNPHVKHLYLVMHGRDQLDSLFPDHYDQQDNAELPAEEMHLVRRGLDAGWPYTYWDPRQDARMVAPEYGGDGTQQAPPRKYARPMVAFPAHWAPNDMVFYDGARWPQRFAKARRFPQRYHHGAFIAFHGSWNRAPLPQRGYQVVFQPLDGASPAGDYETFADGFAGREEIQSPGQAEHRPCGVALGPDGALYVVDSVKGRVWRIRYAGA